MTPIPTTDHDQGPPPLYGAPLGVLVLVLVDGRRWALLPPGDPLVDHLAIIEVEGESCPPSLQSKRPPR